MAHKQRQRRERAPAVELEDEHIAELEVVFELYCTLWDAAADMAPREALRFVLDGLSESGASSDLQAVLAALRALPFVESPRGTMSERDRMWFGLQIMLNQLMNCGKRLLSDELLERVRAERPSAGCSVGPVIHRRVPSQPRS
jgi:hypothetical protein